MYRATVDSVGEFFTGTLPYRPVGADDGWFCDVDRDDFEAVNKVTIYPGKQNVWLVARRKGAGKSISEFVEDNIEDPLNTRGLFGETGLVAVTTPTKLSNDPNKIQLALSVWGRRLQNKTLSKLSEKVGLGTDIEYYLIHFHPPSDAPTHLPWPVEGCIEEADWALSAALSDIAISTGQRDTTITNSSDASTPATSVDAERQRAASLEAMQKVQKLGLADEGMSWTTKLLIIGVIGGGAYFYARSRGMLPQR